MPGTRFGRLVVVDWSRASYGKSKAIHRRYRCTCDCGKETFVASSDLNRGHIVSCGCLNKERAAGRWRKYAGNPALNLQVCSYSATAKRRGLGWDLTHEQAHAFFTGNCHYCGVEPTRKVSIRGGNHETYVNGIDRKDSDLGYTPGNCVSCCKTCNFAKNDLSMEEWLVWLDRIARFRGRQ